MAAGQTAQDLTAIVRMARVPMAIDRMEEGLMA
jgi:hypothetical protein